jgi:hypothetical protein
MSSYVDARLAAEGESEPTPPWEDLTELFGLARDLAAVNLEPPPGFRSELLHYLRENQDGGLNRNAPPARHPLAYLRDRVRGWSGISPVPVAVILLVLAALARLFLLPPEPSVSASEILKRSDQELSKLLRPGYVLHRRIRTTFVGSRPGEPARHNDQVIDEWADGTNPGHVAAQSFTPDGAALWSYVTEREDGVYRPRLYFAPTYSAIPEYAGRLVIRPSLGEVRAAIGVLPTGLRDQLSDLRVQAYVYVPILGDWYRSMAALGGRSQTGGEMPSRQRLSIKEVNLSDGAAGYQVDTYNPSRAMLREGPTGITAIRGECRTRALISRDRYLMIIVTTEWNFEDGRHWLMTQRTEDIEEQRSERIGSRPFEQHVPAGTPVIRWTAQDELSAMAKVLSGYDAPLDTVRPPHSALTRGTR